MPTNRVEAFSDGVFAIAITLLVLNISVPRSRPGRLGHDLAHQWPSYAAYAVSFVIIGIIWVNHHGMYRLVGRVDRVMQFTNLGLLGAVAVLPFTTALLAQYVRSGGANSHLAAAVYSANMTATGIFFLAAWLRLLVRADLRAPGLGSAETRVMIRRTLVGPVMYGASIGLAFVSAPACLVVYALIAAYYAVSYVTADDPSAAAEPAPPGGTAG
ncbi:MAG TPA: TMEM175 family protein [Acidimicrobiia bacterium]|nr:TMEM175 family protein [Acidimicrobiia bacterium]